MHRHTLKVVSTIFAQLVFISQIFLVSHYYVFLRKFAYTNYYFTLALVLFAVVLAIYVWLIREQSRLSIVLGSTQAILFNSFILLIVLFRATNAPTLVLSDRGYMFFEEQTRERTNLIYSPNIYTSQEVADARPGSINELDTLNTFAIGKTQEEYELSRTIIQKCFPYKTIISQNKTYIDIP